MIMLMLTRSFLCHRKKKKKQNYDIPRINDDRKEGKQKESNDLQEYKSHD